MADMLITLNNTQDGFVSQPPGVTVKYDNELHGYLVSGLPEGGGGPPTPPDPSTPIDAQTPTIVNHPSGGSFTQGASASSLTVSAVVFDGGQLSYQWYKNSVNSTAGATAVAGATSSSYTPDTSVAGTSYYYCVVTNTIADNGDGGNKTASVTSNIVAVTINAAVTQKIFGAKWNMSASSTALTRTRDAQNFSFTPTRGGVSGSSSFDGQPVYSGIRLCNLDTSGNVTAYEGEQGFLKTPAVGDVMVEIQMFHYLVLNTVESGNNMREYLVSDQPFTIGSASSSVAPAFVRPDGTTREKIYVGAYTCDSNYKSISGGASVVSITRDGARQGCRGRGSGATAGKYQQFDFNTYWTINLLYLVETANWDSQAAVGQGFTASTNSAQTNRGGADAAAGHSGSTASDPNAGNAAVKYRHIENLWGNIRVWVDGINVYDRVARIATNPAKYVDATDSTHPNGAAVDGYTSLSYTCASANGYISALGYDSNFPYAQLPIAAAGAVGTYIPDYYYQSTTWRAVHVGGSWTYAAVAGLFFVDAYYAATTSSAALGCRLLFLP